MATGDLKLAVNAALALQRLLLIKGEPGTGNTMLAEEVGPRSACLVTVAYQIDHKSAATPV